MSDSGHIIGGEADPQYDGAVLTADVAIGDTVLHVDEVADFDEDAAERGAILLLGLDLDADGKPDPTTGWALAYSTCDDDTQTVTLSAASTVTASSGDRIYLRDPISGDPVGRVEVLVAVDGADQTGDALTAYMDVSLLASVGDADLSDMAVDLDDDEDGQLFVAGFPGLTSAQGDVKFMQDQHTVIGTGDQVFVLTYQPLVNSEHLYWHPAGGAGIYQKADQWARDQWDVTIPDPNGLIAIGDVIVVEYAYRDPTRKPSEAHPNIMVDIPAFNVTDFGGAPLGDVLSTPDTSSEVVLHAGQHVGVGYFGAGPDESTASNGVRVNLPDEPGYVLNRATYVAVAYREAVIADPDPATSDYTSYVPQPATGDWPFLSLDTSATGSFYSLLDLPAGGYAGETVWAADEILHFLTDPVGSQTPSNRVWCEGNAVDTATIHIAYYAIRLTYVWAG